MHCPHCRQAMIVLELHEVEIDYCPQCMGIWLDAGELELLLGVPEKTQKLLGAFREASLCSEKPRHCPLCDKKMKKVHVGTGPQAPLIDACRNNQGLWFDRGELAQIIERGTLDPDHKVIRLLADMFKASGPSVVSPPPERNR